MESTAVEVMDLTIPEKQKLQQLESVIERGMKSFCAVGLALLEIRDGRLYRDSHRTFDDYCRERWGMSKPRATQFIQASQIVENLVTIVTIPANEAQARPLTRLEPEQQRAVWQEAVETAPDGRMTAMHVERVVNKTMNQESRVFNNSDAIRFAVIAISHLERIAEDDPLREKAINKVHVWIHKKEGKK